MDKTNFIIIAFIIFNIITNICWFIMLMRTNDRWCDRLIDFSMRCLKSYKEEKDDTNN